MDPAESLPSGLTFHVGTSGQPIASIFQAVPSSSMPAVESKEKAKTSAKQGELFPPIKNILHYFKPPGKGLLDQENSPPKKKSNAKAGGSGGSGKQHQTSAVYGKNMNLTGWQCPYFDCHRMNSSMTSVCWACGRETSAANLRLILAFEREDRSEEDGTRQRGRLGCRCTPCCDPRSL